MRERCATATGRAARNIVTRVRTAQAEAWTQVAVPPIPTECEALLPVASVRDTFGLDGVLTHRKLAGGWGLDARSTAHAGVARCGISVDFSDGYVAELSALNNGAWAFDHTATWLSPTSKKVTVAGTSGPSHLHCPVGEEAERGKTARRLTASPGRGGRTAAPTRGQ